VLFPYLEAILLGGATKGYRLNAEETSLESKNKQHSTQPPSHVPYLLAT